MGLDNRSVASAGKLNLSSTNFFPTVPTSTCSRFNVHLARPRLGYSMSRMLAGCLKINRRGSHSSRECFRTYKLASNISLMFWRTGIDSVRAGADGGIHVGNDMDRPLSRLVRRFRPQPLRIDVDDQRRQQDQAADQYLQEAVDIDVVQPVVEHT